MMNTRNLLYFKIPILLITLLSIQLELKAQPDNGATNLSFTSIEGNRLRVNWTRGSGQNRLVLMSESPDFSNGIPTDATDYNASSTFGTGDQIGNSNFVVYKGTGTSVLVTGLDSNTTYYVRIYEYDGVNFETLYNTTDVLTGEISTLAKPTLGASDLNIIPTGNAATLTWIRGNGSANLVILSNNGIPNNPAMYSSNTGNGNFNSSTGIGYYHGTNNTVSFGVLEPATWYYVKVLEYNGNSNRVYNYETALVDSFFTATAPTTGSENFTPSTITGGNLSFRYNRGDGAKRLVVMRRDEPVEWEPENGVDYTVGDLLGDNTSVVSIPTGSGGINSFTVNINNLTPSTTYHFALYEFNGSNTNTFYLKEEEYVLRGSMSTLSPPLIQASNLEITEITGNSARIDFSPGNGDRRIVFIREEDPVDNFPITLKSYSSSASYLNAPSEGDSKIVFYGTGTGFNLSNLQPDKIYHLAVFEANGTVSGAVFNQNISGIASFATLGRPTIASDNLQIEVFNGNQIRLHFNKGNGVGRTIIAKEGAPVDAWPEDGNEYNASTTFGNGYELGEGNFIISNNTSSSTSNSITISIGNINPYSEYHFAIVEFNGNGENRLYMFPDDALIGDTLSMVAPEIQASDITFSDITPNSIRVNWENGSGKGRIVLIRPNEPIEDLPNDLQNVTGNSNYSSTLGSLIGSSKVVFSNTQNTNSVEITNIPPGEYHFAIIEFNGSGSGRVYRTSDPLIGVAQVGGPPEIPATNINFNNIDGNRFRINFTTGDGISRLLLVKEGSEVDAWPTDGQDYNANTTFGNGDQIGEGNYVVGISNTIFSTEGFNVFGLKPNTIYHIAIVEYNGTGTNSFYQLPTIVATESINTLSSPVVPTTNIFANNVIGNKMDITWTRGSGDGRLVIARLGEPTSVLPEDLVSHTTRSNFGQSISHMGDENYAVYAGTSDNFTLSNLEPDTTYHLTFFEYNGSSGRVYQKDTITRTSFKTDERPSVPASGFSYSNPQGDRVSFSYSRGNGSRRLVVIRKGTPVDAFPQDRITYSTSANYGEGQEIGEGNFVLNTQNSTSFTARNLEPDTEYYIAVFEYDGSNGNERYFVNEFLSGKVKTASPPTIPSSNITINSVTSSNVNLSWSKGDGVGRVIILRPNQPVDFVTTDLSSLNTGNSFNQQGNHRIVYRGTAETVTVQNLAPATTYYVAIIEYNGTNQPVYSTVRTRSNFTTLPDVGNDLVLGGLDVLVLCNEERTGNEIVEIPYFNTQDFVSGNIIHVDLLTTDQTAQPRTISSLSTTNNNGFISFVIPSDVVSDVNYRLRIRSTNPELESPITGADILIQSTPIPEINLDQPDLTSCGVPIRMSIDPTIYNIQWYKDSQVIPFATNEIFQATESGQYSVALSAASGTCESASDSLELAIYQQPDFELQLNSVYCEQDQPANLTETLPIGGNYIGNGIAGDIFDPSLAGVGQHLIYYLYVDDMTQCRDSSFQSVQVIAFPEVNLNLEIDTLYTDQDEINLTSATPAGGVYYLKHNGSESVIQTLIPENLSPGIYELVYRYGDPAELCSAADSIEFIVLNTTVTVIAPTLNNLCKGSSADYSLPDGFPTGGVWSGDFVNNNQFSVANAPLGVYELIYTIEEGGDFYSDTTELRVAASHEIDSLVYLCEGETYTINTTTITTAGLHEISLGQTQYGCDSTMNLTVVVIDTPTLTSDVYTYTSNSVEIDIRTLIQNYVAGAEEKYTFDIQQSNPNLTIDNVSDWVIRYTVPQGYLGNTSFDLELCTCTNCNELTVNLAFNITQPFDFIADRGSRYTIPFDEVYQSSYGEYRFLKLDTITKEALASVINNDVNDFYIDYSTAMNEVDVDSVYYELCDTTGTICPINGYFRITFNITNEPVTPGLPPIEVYNAISPNNDGKHDFMQIVNIEAYPNNRVVVFNRWGDVIFDKEAYDNSSVVWDGKGKNNDLVNDGSYFYTIYLDKEKGARDGNLQKGYVYVSSGE